MNTGGSWLGGAATRLAMLGKACLIVSASIAAGAAPTTAADSFYKDKTIRILTSESGSGYDTAARMVSRHLPAHIDGGTSVIVQSMPGATVKVPLYLTEVVARDSTVIAVLNNAIAFAPLLNVPQANFDPTKFNWLGSPSTELGLALVWHTVPVYSIDDATKREVIMGVGGGGSSATFYGRLLNAILGTKFKLLPGYSGMAGAFLAMERGETEGFPSTLWNSLKATKPEWIADKKVRFLVQYGGAPSPELPDVPFARDLAKSEEDRMVLDAAIAPMKMGRPFAMAPLVPAEHVALMRASMMATFTAPAFVEDAKKQRFDVDARPKSGEELMAIVASVYNAPEQVRNRLAALHKQDDRKR